MESSPYREALTEREREHGIRRLRPMLPVSVLGHHDRMLERGMKSIVVAEEGHCTACGHSVPGKALERMHEGYELEVCDCCGTFLYLSSPRKPRQLKKLSAAKQARLAVLLGETASRP